MHLELGLAGRRDLAEQGLLRRGGRLLLLVVLMVDITDVRVLRNVRFEVFSAGQLIA